MIRATGDKILAREIKTDFDEIKVGDVELSLTMREGSLYNSFSHRVEVIHNYEGCVYDVGDELVVTHFVLDQKINIEDNDLLIVYPEQILGKRVTVSKDISGFEAVNGYFCEPKAISDNLSNRDYWELNSATSVNGVDIEYLTDADYEIWINELMYIYVSKTDCVTENGRTGVSFNRLTVDGERFRIEDGREIIIDSSRIFKCTKGKIYHPTESIKAYID